MIKFLHTILVCSSNTRVAAAGMRLPNVGDVAAFSSTFDVETCRRDALAFGRKQMSSRVCLTPV